MKNKLKYIVSCILAIVIISACEDKSKYPVPDVDQGAIPLFAQKDDDSGIINLLDLPSSKLSFTLTKEGLAEVESIDLTIIFNNNASGESDTIIYQNVTTVPADFTMDLNTLLSAFDTNVVTIDTLGVGDSFVVGGNMKMTDGRYLNGGYSPSIASKRPVFLTYNVACPSSIPTGTYIATQNDEAAWFGDITTKEVTITKVVGTVNQYLISDVSGGGYALCCLAYGYHADQPAIVSDICNTIIVSGTGGSQIESGQGPDASGSWDEATGTMIVHYEDTINSTGDLMTVFVKK